VVGGPQRSFALNLPSLVKNDTCSSVGVQQGRGSEPNSESGELEESEEGGAELVVARCDAAELFRLVQEAPDVDALVVGLLLPALGLFPMALLGLLAIAPCYLM
jgi:hypothetical protein